MRIEGGAELVEIEEGPSLIDISAAELIVLLAEFNDGLKTYLAMTAPERVGKRTKNQLKDIFRSDGQKRD
jgi:hypothetical protein